MEVYTKISIIHLINLVRQSYRWIVKNSFNKNRGLLAFTLAEVLITLAIIGVVSAMTIPSLVANYQKSITATRLEKTFSQFAQAFNMSQAQNGSSINWVIDSPSSDRANILNFNKIYMFPYLKTAKICDSTDGSDLYNCWPSNVKYLDGTTYVINISQNVSYILADGSSVLTGCGSTYMANWVDINGMSGPNIVGKDVFRINYTINGYSGANSGLYMDSTNQTRDDILNGIPGNAINSCNKSSRGTSCGSVIQKDSWQIKDDYPW